MLNVYTLLIHFYFLYRYAKYYLH